MKYKNVIARKKGTGNGNILPKLAIPATEYTTGSASDLAYDHCLLQRQATLHEAQVPPL